MNKYLEKIAEMIKVVEEKKSAKQEIKPTTSDDLHINGDNPP